MAGLDAIDWTLISLRRTPERLDAFREVNRGIAPTVEVLEAVDGLEVDKTGLARSGLMQEGLDWRPGAIGAALSHRKCWERAVETGRPVGILEDDIYLRHDFLERVEEVVVGLPDDWDIIHLGYNTDSIFQLELHPGCMLRGQFDNGYPTIAQCEQFVLTTGPVAPARVIFSFGNCCYLVSPRGAEKLLEGCFPLTPHTGLIPVIDSNLVAKSKDMLMNGLYWKMSAFVCLPPIAMPVNDKPASTVGVT